MCDAFANGTRFHFFWGCILSKPDRLSLFPFISLFLFSTNKETPVQFTSTLHNPHHHHSGLQLFERSSELQKYNHARATAALTEASRVTRTKIAEAAIRDAKAAANASAAAASADRRRAARLAREAEAAERRASAPVLANLLLEARTRGFLAEQRAAGARSRAAVAATAARRAAAAAAAREEWHDAMRRVSLQQALDAAVTARLAAKNGAKAAKGEAVASARIEILASLRASAGACSRSQRALRQRLFDEELALRRSPERIRRAAAELMAERRRIPCGGSEEAPCEGSAESCPRGEEEEEEGEVVVEKEEGGEVVEAAASASVGRLPLRGAADMAPPPQQQQQQQQQLPAAAPSPLSPLPEPPAQFKEISRRRRLSCFGRSLAKGDEKKEEEEEEADEAEDFSSKEKYYSTLARAVAAAAPVLTAASAAKTTPAAAPARPTIRLPAKTTDSSARAHNIFVFACASPPKTRGGGIGPFLSVWAATAEA